MQQLAPENSYKPVQHNSTYMKFPEQAELIYGKKIQADASFSEGSSGNWQGRGMRGLSGVMVILDIFLKITEIVFTITS